MPSSDIRTIIAELRESYADIKSSDGTGYYVARDFFLGKCEHLPRLLDYIAKLEADNHELRHSIDRASSYAEDITIPNIDAMCEKIKRLEAVADAAEVVYAEWGEEEIACEFEEWRNLRTALDATDCDIKSGGE